MTAKKSAFMPKASHSVVDAPHCTSNVAVLGRFRCDACMSAVQP